MSTKIIPRFRNKPKRRQAYNRKTHEQYVEELKVKNPNIIVKEEYKGAQTEIYHYCTIHQVYWKILPSNVLSGQGCYQCRNDKISNTQKMTDAEYLGRLSKRNIVPLEKYINARTPIWHWFRSCGHLNKTSPMSILSGGTCLICSNILRSVNMMKTHSEFVKELKQINNKILTISEYTGAHNKILCKCLVCNNEWETSPHVLLCRSGCPCCAESHGERNIERFLIDHDIPYNKWKTFNSLIGIGGRLLSYDFYLPTYNKLIEFQGEQHQRPIEMFGGKRQFEIQKEHDKRKREYAQSHNIDLLEIWYYDFDNIESILKDNLNILSVETTGVA